MAPAGRPDPAGGHHPNPEGGVIYLFDDVTERLDLERRYDALIRVQGETLDNLTEAVAVFASDGRLRLYNPVFARMWRLSSDMLSERPHVEAVSDWTRPLHGEHPIWQTLRATITAIDDREPVVGRLDRPDGKVVDCATVPLPDGATLVTFQDVTDTVNVERALREETRHWRRPTSSRPISCIVSYELRSPLTNIIGFAHFLGDPHRPAHGKAARVSRLHHGVDQRAARHHQQHPRPRHHRRRHHDAQSRLRRHPQDHGSRRRRRAGSPGQERHQARIRAAPDIGTFVADERRVRQSLFNLLANAVGFSPGGEIVTFAAQRRKDAVVFSVTDRGPGIPADVQDKVFDWFETHSLGSRHRGTGLGLSLVRSFVELHGGSVTLESAVGRGTTVTCVFRSITPPSERRRDNVGARSGASAPRRRAGAPNPKFAHTVRQRIRELRVQRGTRIVVTSGPSIRSSCPGLPRVLTNGSDRWP